MMRLKQGFPFLLVVILLSLFTKVGALAETSKIGVTDVESLGWVTGPESANETKTKYDVDGADLGSMFALGDTVYIAFGDTFGCCRPPEGGGGGSDWRSNVMGYSTDRDLSDGMTLDGMFIDHKGDARQLLRKSLEDVTIIPTNGIAVDQRMYLHYMGVREWGEPGHWTLSRSGWAYSDDKGETWKQPKDATWEGDTNFGQAALVNSEGNIYVFGIHGGRYGGVQLARVPQADVLDMSKYSYWSGSDWAKDVDSATEIVSAPVGELSVAYNTFLGRWIMLYLHEPMRAIVMRTAETVTGPWSDPITVVSADDYPGLYGAFLHPWASDSETIYFNMSQWVPYNVRLMRVRLTQSNEGASS